MSMSAIFGNNGGFGHLLKQTIKVPAPGFQGAWSIVELQPDVFVPQWFSIGVVVQSSGDRLHFKLLDEFKKFECVYGDRFPQRMIRELMTYAEETLRVAAQDKIAVPEVAFETSALRLSVPMYTSGEDREVTVERLFTELIVMAPHSKRKGRDFTAMDNSQVRALVNAELKRIAQMDYEKIVIEGTSNTGMLVEDQGVKHYLDFNLRTTGACGSVVSAVYKSPISVELNLLKSSRDLTTYSRLKNVADIGLFMLLPDEQSMEPKEYKHIGDLITEQEWKLERDGFRVVSFASEKTLAEEIYEWAKPTIA